MKGWKIGLSNGKNRVPVYMQDAIDDFPFLCVFHNGFYTFIFVVMILLRFIEKSL